MAKDDRLWVAFSMQFDEHPKIAILSDAAYRALTEMIFYCRRNENDGRIPMRFAERKWGREALEELASNDSSKPSVTIASTSDDKQTASNVLANTYGASGCYVLLHDYLEHHPSKSDLDARRNGISEKRREAGRKGGLAKAARSTSNNKQTSSRPVATASNRVANDKQNVAKSKSKKDTSYEVSITSSSTTSTAASRQAEHEREFHENFWPAYPKKVGKQDALKAFIKARKTTDLETILEGVNRYSSQPFEDSRLIKHPQGWLNGKRWEDEVTSNALSTRPAHGTSRIENARNTYNLIEAMDWPEAGAA